MNAKARAQATKMANFDVAVETRLAETRRDLDGEIASFRNAKMALRTYLQGQVRTRKLLHFGNYKNIPLTSQFRSNSKPYKIRITPNPMPGIKITTDMEIAYLTKLLYVMIEEDLARPLERTALPEDIQLVRKLPVISQLFLNPESLRLKQLQESRIAAMASPLDNPLYARLEDEYLGKILYDGGFFRVFAIQFVPNKGQTLRPCTFPFAHPSPVPYPHPFPDPHPHTFH
jgi:hypothetical protein